jgi:hypothetical protein
MGPEISPHVYEKTVNTIMPSGNSHNPPRSNCLCWTESLALETPDTDILMCGVRFPVFHLKYSHRTFFFAIPAPVTEDMIDVHLHLYSGGRDGKHIWVLTPELWYDGKKESAPGRIWRIAPGVKIRKKE